MEQIISQVENLIKNAREYVNTAIELAKVEAAGKAAKFAAGATAILVSLLLFMIFLVFASVGIAFLLSSLIGKMYAGFLIVAIIYLIIGMVVWFGRESIMMRPIRNVMVKLLFENEKTKK